MRHSARSIPALLDLLTDDVEWTLQGPSVIPFAGTRHGHEGVAEFFSVLGETLEFEQFEPREFVAQGDTVVVVGIERSVSKATGRTIEHEGHTSTRSGTARSPSSALLKTQVHTLPRFIVVGFERSVSVGRAGDYNVSVLPFTTYSPECLEKRSEKPRMRL